MVCPTGAERGRGREDTVQNYSVYFFYVAMLPYIYIYIVVALATNVALATTYVVLYLSPLRREECY